MSDDIEIIKNSPKEARERFEKDQEYLASLPDEERVHILKEREKKREAMIWEELEKKEKERVRAYQLKKLKAIREKSLLARS